MSASRARSAAASALGPAAGENMAPLPPSVRPSARVRPFTVRSNRLAAWKGIESHSCQVNVRALAFIPNLTAFGPTLTLFLTPA